MRQLHKTSRQVNEFAAWYPEIPTLAAQREGNRLLAIMLSEVGLTPAQSEALRIIAYHGLLALKELGDMLVCDTGTNPSRIVDCLVAANLVHRAVGDQDRRMLRLAAEGSHRG